MNNPKGDRQEFAAEQGAGGMFRGSRIGQGALNECAAWLIDASERSHGFSLVPPTAAAYTEHSAFWHNTPTEAKESPFRMIKAKVGSLQRFESAVGCAEDFSPSCFSALAVQRIALLDIRLFNMDRHGGNMLVQRCAARQLEWAESGADAAAAGGGTAGGGGGADSLHLIPIDHGFCLPERPTLASFEWRGWAQAAAPLEPAALEYVRRLDAAADAALLRRAGCGAPRRISPHLAASRAPRPAAPHRIVLLLAAPFLPPPPRAHPPRQAARGVRAHDAHLHAAAAARLAC